jgi:hypothetical protein
MWKQKLKASGVKDTNIFFNLFIFILCALMCCLHECLCEGVGSSRNGVTDSCELHVDAGN